MLSGSAIQKAPTWQIPEAWAVFSLKQKPGVKYSPDSGM